MNSGRSDAENTYRRYYPVIRAKCRRMLSDDDDAQDVAQETFERLCQQQRALASADTILAWLYRAATRLAIDRLRRRAVAARWADAVGQNATADLGNQVMARDFIAAVAARLAPDELEVLILTRIDGVTQREAATIMGLGSDREVRRILGRAEASLARLKEKSDYDR